MRSKKVSFYNSNGYKLSARLELPLLSEPDAYAVFVHAFTGSKSLKATRNISRTLTLNGIAVLRFDFTGLGDSEGDFADTNFTSNVEDVLAACDYLREHHEAPRIIIGHSLGGAASIFAAAKVDSIKAVATIGTPSEPEHVTHLIESGIDEIESTGKAVVNIGGRPFTIKKHFLEDIKSQDMYKVLRDMKKALLVMHSPQDNIVEIENAAKIYHAAFHPKSFVTLNKADHMLTNKDDAFYAGNVISSWVIRYIERKHREELSTHKQVVASLGLEDGFTTEIKAGAHGLIADESEKLGGQDFGPSPYEMLNAALGACTVMTMQMYARRKGWDLQDAKVHLSYNRSYKEDCENCSTEERMLHHIEKVIELKGDLNNEQRARLVEIANRCPVHRTLKKGVEFNSSLQST